MDILNRILDYLSQAIVFLRGYPILFMPLAVCICGMVICVVIKLIKR